MKINEVINENVGKIIEKCFYGHGFVYFKQFRKKNNKIFTKASNSWAALTICHCQDVYNVVEGFLLLENVGFTLQLENGAKEVEETGVKHNKEIRNVKGRKRKRNVDHYPAENHQQQKSFFNLTGDTFDVLLTSNGEVVPVAANLIAGKLQTNKRKNRGLIYENSLLEQSDEEELGYFYDSAWKSVKSPVAQHFTSKNPHRYLEILIAVDDSVIKFHGRVRVKQYVLTLMNIVNALYQDPSLDANLQIVIRELHLLEKKQTAIRLGNAKKSLENVNLWNKNVHQSYADGDVPHDIALWLTRTDIGGPSGYAPVAGVCDPERSCALTRDEGLTCAFIIAHELAHILGLSHDGDAKNNNTCRDEALQGSVMAPMVSATFHHFLWSQCSRKEFAARVSQWQCLLNAPDAQRSIELNSTLGARFTMDEQCRVEFGEGYELCRSFNIVEPCAHLWCAHNKSPFVCKTKKGPPLEGTECGPQKWCIDGYCDSTLRINLDPLKYNPQDGGWSDWGEWSSCSRSCDLGIQFRARTCNNPKPAYGGQDCPGLPEEWRVCNPQICHEKYDFRAQQCVRMPKLLDVPKNLTFLPFESENIDFKCKFICKSKETNKIYASDDEFLTDGTLCSYDTNNMRCVQGKCVSIGCDNRINSSAIDDGCGVCNGNNSECLRIKYNATKRIKKQIARLAVLHNQARHIALEFTPRCDNPNAQCEIDFDLFLKDRKRNVFPIRKSARGVTAPAEMEFNQGQSGENNAHPNDVPIESNQYYTDGISIVTIVHGAQFRLHSRNQSFFLNARGPILNELVLYINFKSLERNNLKLHVKMEYLLHKNFKETQYEWIIGGWGSCSTSCGGGKMFKTKACVEKSTQRIVARKMCSIVSKPPTEVRKCNDFSCNFIWIPGQWEPCSATCGKTGVQHRELFCVPQNRQNDSVDLHAVPWKYMLPPTKCGYQPPPTTRPCNNINCPGHWEYSTWSNCSPCLNSCKFPDFEGNFEQFRVAECKSNNLQLNSVNLNETNCDSLKIERQQTQFCEIDTNLTNEIKNTTCIDTSGLCAMESSKRYCQIDSFRDLCCHSCLGLTQNLISI